MNALRMEKGFKGAGELTNEVTLPEADVMRFVKPDKDFLGRRNPCRARQAAALGVRLSGNRAGRRLGRQWRRGGAAGWRGGRLDRVGGLWPYGRQNPRLRLLKPHAAEPGTALEVFMNETWRPARVLGEAAYDPAGLLPRTDAPACEAAQ
jgi:dimethylglycine dehydrogenase